MPFFDANFPLRPASSANSKSPLFGVAVSFLRSYSIPMRIPESISLALASFPYSRVDLFLSIALEERNLFLAAKKVFFLLFFY